jgi:hypothetical protein
MAVFVAASTVCAIAALAQVTLPEPDPAASLRDRYAALSEQLEQSSLQQGLYLESAESPHAVQGDVYAVVNYPFATVSDTFTNPQNWCELLILHLNVKYCRADVGDEQTVLSVAIGKKFDQPLSEAYRVKFAYNVTASGSDYMQVDLDARKGPLGTSKYHIALESIGLEGDRAFLHLRYSYAFGHMARFAMRVYLATSGHGKVGFTMIQDQGNRPSHLIGGVRGTLERNTMRYYLALDAYLGTLATPDPQRFEESLERWFAATERYARQLHEVDHDAYLTMKRREYLRQQTPP